jgi:hypothetical protein
MKRFLIFHLLLIIFGFLEILAGILQIISLGFIHQVNVPDANTAADMADDLT